MLLGLLFNILHAIASGFLLWAFSEWFISPLVKPYDDFHMTLPIALGIALLVKVFTYHPYQEVKEQQVDDFFRHHISHLVLYLVLGVIVKFAFMR
jgi:hypothetical protein